MDQEVKIPDISHGPYLTEESDDDGGPRLIASECVDCGHRMFPPAPVCPGCMGENMKPLVLSRVGKLYTYSILNQGPRWIEAPYVSAYIDMPEGVRVFTHLTGLEPDEIEFDMPVSLVICDPVVNSDGQEVLKFKFGPVKQDA